MEFFIWEDNFNTGIELIDNQHKTLVNIINILFNHISRLTNDTNIDDIFKKLMDYTITHFETEENLFIKNNYPYYKLHKDEHDKFKTKILENKKRYRENEIANSVELNTFLFLKDWLINHILLSDKKYVPFLVDKDIS